LGEPMGHANTGNQYVRGRSWDRQGRGTALTERAFVLHSHLETIVGRRSCRGSNGSIPARCHAGRSDEPQLGSAGVVARVRLARALALSGSPYIRPQIRSVALDVARRPPVTSGAPAIYGVHPTHPVVAYPSAEPSPRGTLGGDRDRARSASRCVSPTRRGERRNPVARPTSGQRRYHHGRCRSQ